MVDDEDNVSSSTKVVYDSTTSSTSLAADSLSSMEPVYDSSMYLYNHYPPPLPPPPHHHHHYHHLPQYEHNMFEEFDNSDSTWWNPNLFCVVEADTTEHMPSKPKKTKLLPPCRICGEKASGLHYGVNTCEACKLVISPVYSKLIGLPDISNTQTADSIREELWGSLDGACHGEITFSVLKTIIAKLYQEKEITAQLVGTRNVSLWECQRKDLLAVFSAIKIGRYTHEKRTQDIIEVKNINITTSNDGSKPDIVKMEPTSSSDDQEGLQLSIYNRNKGAHSHLTEINQKTLPTVHEQKIIYSMSVVNEMQKYMKRLSESLVHMKYFFAAKPPAQLPNLVQKRLAESRLETDLLGHEVMPNTEYVKVMAETGLDLDSRKELIQHWAEGIEETFIVIAQFAKCTPGFLTLPMEDQITLIKATRSQLLFVASHKRFDIGNKCFIGRFNRVESFQDIIKIYNNEKFVHAMISLAGMFLKMKLTDLEWLLVLARILTHPDSELFSQLSDEAKSTLKVMHTQEERILDFYLTLNHPDKPHLGSMIHTASEELRRSDRDHTKIITDMRVIWKDYLNFPPLFEEMMSTTFNERIILRSRPKSPDRAQTQGSCSTISIKSPRQHWKKSKIAQILESSEHIEKLMSAAKQRSHDENIIPPDQMGMTGSDFLSPSSDISSPPPSVGEPALNLKTKLNDCYGISFGDPLDHPADDDFEPLSKILDKPFSSVLKGPLNHHESDIQPTQNADHSSWKTSAEQTLCSQSFSSTHSQATDSLSSMGSNSVSMTSSNTVMIASQPQALPDSHHHAYHNQHNLIEVTNGQMYNYSSKVYEGQVQNHLPMPMGPSYSMSLNANHQRLILQPDDDCKSNNVEVGKTQKCMKFIHHDKPDYCLRAEDSIIQCRDSIRDRYTLGGMVTADVGNCDGIESNDYVAVEDLTYETEWMTAVSNFDITFNKTQCGKWDGETSDILLNFDRSNTRSQWFMSLSKLDDNPDTEFYAIEWKQNDTKTLNTLATDIVNASNAYLAIEIKETSTITALHTVEAECTDNDLCSCTFHSKKDQPKIVKTFLLVRAEDGFEDKYQEMHEGEQPSFEGPEQIPPKDDRLQESDEGSSAK